MQHHQAPVKQDGQQPDGQCQDKKKVEVTAIKVRNRMEMSRLVMVGRLEIGPLQYACLDLPFQELRQSLSLLNLTYVVNPYQRTFCHHPKRFGPGWSFKD